MLSPTGFRKSKKWESETKYHSSSIPFLSYSYASLFQRPLYKKSDIPSIGGMSLHKVNGEISES